MARSMRRVLSPSTAKTWRGVNMSGLEFTPGTLPGTENTNYTKNTLHDYQYAKSLGIGIVRLPFLWERLQPTLSGALDTTYKGYIDQNITWAGQNGLRVLLDCHNYGGRDVNGTQYRISGASLSVAHFTDLWSRISSAYANSTIVWGYDLMNEPNAMPIGTTPSTYITTSTWNNAAQQAINAIRQNDSTHYISACTDNWSGVQSFFDSHGANPTTWWSDSANKLYYSCHYYFDSDHSGGYTGNNTAHTGTGFNVRAHGNFLQNLIDWAKPRNVNLLIGEVGVINDEPIYELAMEDFYRVADGYPNCIVFHWAMGSWYTSATTLGPTNSYATEKSQAKVVKRHLGTNTP